MKKMLSLILFVALLMFSGISFAESGFEIKQMMEETDSMDAALKALFDGSVVVACVSTDDGDKYLTITHSAGDEFLLYDTNNGTTEKATKAELEEMWMFYFFIFDNMQQ